MGTPVLSHLSSLALAVLFLALLIRRGASADIAIAGLLAASLLFALSFFVVSIACDYRYLYFLDLAAMTGALKLASSASGAFLTAAQRRLPRQNGMISNVD